jgi:hypothetical protein
MESNEAIGFFVYAQDLLLLPCRLVCNQASDQAFYNLAGFYLAFIRLFCLLHPRHEEDGRWKKER